MAQTSISLERLRESREKAGITQQKLARLCEISLNQISRYERGFQEPSLTTAKKIAEVLNVSLDYLVGVVDSPTAQIAESDLNIYEREILETYRRKGWAGLGHLSVEKLAK